MVCMCRCAFKQPFFHSVKAVWGIRSGLVVMIPGSKTSQQLRVSAGSPSYINVWHWAAWPNMTYDLFLEYDTMELKRREFLPSSESLSCCDKTLSVESDIKPHSFLPSIEGSPSRYQETLRDLAALQQQALSPNAQD